MLILAAIPMALIMLQPDLGTDLVFLAILFAMLVAAGIKGRHLAVLVMLGVALVVVVIHLGVLQRYQVDRLTAFLDPTSDTQSTATTSPSRRSAIGNGGLTGKGLFKGTLTNLSYVPEQRTDFIFTAVGEQLGFVGSALLLLLFAILVWRCWRAAMSARDRTGTLICVGVMALHRVPGVRERRHDDGHHAHRRHPAPVRELRRARRSWPTASAIGLVLNVHMRRFT